MFNDTIARELAAQRAREVERGTAQRRLAALARCCRPSQLARLFRRLVDRAPTRPTAATRCA